MIKQILIIVMVPFACSNMLMGTTDTAKIEQALYHVWTPEPELISAIACQENDFSCEHLEDPNKHKEVPLPASVRTAIYKLTRKTFEDRLYEGLTRYADLFGPVYRIIVPDSNRLHLYVYQLKPIPWLSFRYYSFVLILHNVTTDTFSAPVSMRTDSQSYCSRPWIRFKDILGDSTTEILILTGEHNGNVLNCMHQHILQIESGVNLCELGVIKTGIWSPFVFPKKILEEGCGYLVRIIDKVDHSHFSAIVSYSRNKQKQGEIILGYEDYKLQEKTGLSRSSVQVVGETEDEMKNNKKILMSEWFF